MKAPSTSTRRRHHAPDEGTVPVYSTEPAWSTQIRGIKPWGPYPEPSKGGKRQRHGGEWGLAVPVLEQFPSGDVPHGLEVEYEGSNRNRFTSAEKRELERLHTISYQEVRTAAECHRQVRKHMQVRARLPTMPSAARPMCARRTQPCSQAADSLCLPTAARA